MLLLVALVVGEVADFGHADADGPFSLPAIAAFIGGVGFIGAIPAALSDGMSTVPRVLISLAVGVLGALPLAFGALRLTAGLMRMRTDPTLTESDLIGRLGQVITSIPTGGLGEVRLSVGGQQLKYYARSVETLPAGTPVYVIDTPTPTSTDSSGQKVVMGASVFVLPVVQKLHTIDLSSRRIPVGIRGAVSKQGVKCDLEGVAIVKVGGSESSIRAAAQRFLNQQGGIDTFTSEVLAGALRSIVGRLTIEEIIRDRAAFASAVAEEAETSLTGKGLVLDTFQLQDIQAEGSYLADLGRPEAARVVKEAAIAEARARQASEQEQLLAEEAIAISNRQLALKQAEISAEIDAAKAQAAAAGPLAQAAQDQLVLIQQEKVAERTAALKERQLDTEVRKPADADRYRIEQQAEANKNASVFRADADRQSTLAAAQADAEKARLSGEGERARRSALADAEAIEGAKKGEAERLRRQSIAEAAERECAADASAILARGKAEAEAMDQRSQAFSTYGEAAVLDLLVKVLPDIVNAAAAPLAAVDKITMITSDGNAGSLAKTVAGNVAQGLQLTNDLTGVDLGAMLARLGGNSATATADEARIDGSKSAGAVGRRTPQRVGVDGERDQG